MKNKMGKFSSVFFSMLIAIAMLCFAPAFAWSVNKLATNLSVTANVIGSYFEQGNGTQDTPYVIARPIQMYYFAWLQNLGYFDGDNPASTTSDKKFYFTLSADIDMNDNLEYATLPPIGTAEYPFKGVFDGKYHYAPTDTNGNPTSDPLDPNNTLEGTYHKISNVTINNTNLSHMPDGGDDGMQYLGLFGVVGSMNDTSVKGEIKNFALDGVTIETADPVDDKTIIGIVAGYCNGITSGIGVSNCTIAVANGLSPAELPINSTNPDTGVVTTEIKAPETLSFSLIGFSDKTYEAYNISPVAGGEEFGGSLMMEDIYDRILDARDNSNAVYAKYYTAKTVLIDEDGNVTETETGETTYQYTNGRYYRLVNNEVLDEDDNVIESYSIVKRYSSSAFTTTTNNYMYLTGGFEFQMPQTITTITKTRYDAFIIGDGNGNYLVGNTSSTANTNSSSEASAWRFSNDTAGGTFAIQINEVAYYLYNNNGTLTTSSTNSTNWTVDASGHITNNGYYLCCIDGVWRLWQETTYYTIDDGNGTYLNYANGNITSGSTATTRWHIASNKIYTYNGNTKVYLYNNNGTLTTTTTANTANIWTINNNQITNNGYYLCYNDGAWALTKETGYYYIHNGNGTYLNASAQGLSAGTSSNATRWFASNNKYYTYINGVETYLYNNGGALTTTTNVNTASTWTSANNTFKNGAYYLIYNNVWMLTQEEDFYLISDGYGNYLNLTSSGYDVGTSTNATNWHFTNGTSGGKIYTYINGVQTYMYNNNGSLSTTTSSATASTWVVNNNQITNNGYYLVYASSWLLTNEASYYLIHDGNGNYLNLTSSGYDIGTSTSVTNWHFSNGSTGGKIYTYINGVQTYMYNNNGVLSTTTNVNTASTWVVNNGQISNGGYYLVYGAGGWRLVTSASFYAIQDGNGHYLNLTSSGFSVGTSTSATDWQFTSTTSGKIYTYINGVQTYMYNNNGTLSTTTNVNTASTWNIINNDENGCYNISNNGYFLRYDSGAWSLTQGTEFTIHDNSGHYLNLNASTHLTEVGTSSNATVWTFSNGASGGYISTNVNGTQYYLNYSYSNMVPGTSAETTWSVANNQISCAYGSDTYYMFYDGSCWTIVLSTTTSYYIIGDGNGNYMGVNLSGSTNGTIINTTVRSYATKWNFASGVLTTSGGYITTKINNVTRYLYRNSNTGTTLSLNSSSNSYSAWCYTNTNGSQRIYVKRTNNNRYYYIRFYNNGWTTLSNYTTSTTSNYLVNGSANINSATKTAVAEASEYQYSLVAKYESHTYNLTNTITFGQYDFDLQINHEDYDLTVMTPYTAYNLTANTTSYNYDLENVTTPTTTVWQHTDVDNNGTQTVRTVDTYIPLALNNDGSVSEKNTGYIVSGANYNSSDTYPGDIRVSYYAISGNLNVALNGNSYSGSRLEVVTRTYLSNGFVRISDDYNSSNSSVNSSLSSSFPNKRTPLALGLDKYTDSRDQLHTTLSSSSNVYGLHFMDAQININRLVNIGKATINHATYENYPMPQDCIDFNLNTKGSLNFFAGSYFPGNTAFFSLHHIERNGVNITSIKEISKIYGDPSNSAKSYIYQYSRENAPTLPTGYVLMFDTTWITAPTMVENAMYYFEIPVNAGEYALGSVSGKNGAYLIYLDIGASGKALADGTTLETSITGMDFVMASSLTNANIATTLSSITDQTNSVAVIVLKNRFQGSINIVRQNYVENGVDKVRITYTLTDASAADYVKWTRASNDTEIVYASS